MALELLAPAKNVEQGLLALRCGADAVYVGGPRFGARQGAANDLKELERLVREAHLWRARVYVTLNTLVYDAELEEARRTAWALAELGVDALIIQDMAFLEMQLPDVPLHASTQAVCDSPEKVAFLAANGVSRAILARELSLAEMRAIHLAAPIELEAFVYGALCVAESGRCALSMALTGRSGNRGECAQPCRASWDLLDRHDKVIVRERPLLSIQDLDVSDYVEAMVDAGVQSFKIEGRLKDADYVKNVVSYLRTKLDALLLRRPELERASAGRVQHAFTPDPKKTFHRGHSVYRLDGERRSVATGAVVGRLGEPVGRVRSLAGDRLLLDRDHALAAGDGLAFVDMDGKVAGTLVNGVQARQVFVQNPAQLCVGTELFRNLDHAFMKVLGAANVERRLTVSARLEFRAGQAWLQLRDEDGCTAVVTGECAVEAPNDPEAFRQTVAQALARLGETPFELGHCEVHTDHFVPVSRLNALRRAAVAALVENRLQSHPREHRRAVASTPVPLPVVRLDHTWNIANALAQRFYEKHGGVVCEQALEVTHNYVGKMMMTTRLCLRFELGVCPRHENPEPWLRLSDPGEPLTLKNGPHRLRCEFDCVRCRMLLVLER